MKNIMLLLVALGALAVPVLLQAQTTEASPLSLELRAEMEKIRIEPNGTRSVELVEADLVLPGETVVYTITYTNSGDAPADNVVINNPVPAEMSYLEGSAVGEGTQIEFSVDGETFGIPSELVVPLADGSSRPAEPDEYRAVRWTLLEAIPANSEGFVRYRALLR